MNIKSLNQLPGFIALLVSAGAFAQTQVPNTFQAGQPARAAEVNDNFSTLESAANQNASDIAGNTNAITNNTALIQANTAAISASRGGIQVLAAGTSIGLFVMVAQSRPGLDGYRAASDLNYFFDVIAMVDPFSVVAQDRPSITGDLFTSVVWFESAGCVGPAYTSPNPAGRIDKLESLQGFVFRSDDPTDPVQTYYVPSGSQEVDLIVSYRRSFLEGGCVFVGTPTNTFVPVFPNDLVATGVPTASFAGPILLGY